MTARLLCLALLGFGLLFAPQARAEQEYADVTFPNVMHTLIRFNAIDLKDDALLDEYAMITDCDLFKFFYPNDFKWNEVRAAMRKDVSLNIATYPTQYHYDTKVQLGRYDFKLKSFRFTEDATIRNVNMFEFINEHSYSCGNSSVKHLPLTYNAVLDVPVSILGLPFAENEADALLDRLDKNGNTDHVLYARFSLRVVNVDPLRKINAYGDRPYYSQSSKSSGHEMRIDVRLDSVDFYEDEDMTKLVYSYRS